jgi:imidazolonepropionase-like amidohydrolase
LSFAANALLTIAITHVTVIDTTGGPARGDMTVQIAGDRITSVGPAVSAAIPKGAQVIDGTGKFLIPGLWDMHIHAFFGDWVPGGREATLPLFVANGRMLISGPMLDGPKSQFPAAIAIATPEEGRRAVAMLQGRGVDFIKIQSYVPREAYLAIADECRKRKIRFEGHVPDAMRASEASDAGQASFEHLIGVFEGSSTAEEAFLEGKKGPARFLETWDPAREASVAKLLAMNGTWQCPTLFWERGQWLVDAIDVSKDPDAKYAPAHWRETSWPTFAKGILKDLATDPLPVRQRFVEHELEIVKRLQRAEVPFLAGTDTPAGVDVIPGFSLHRELERFVAAGFTPMEALQTATINPAKFLGRRGDFGTVEKGRVADLVLLDANPLEDIRNTQKIAAVVANGRYLARSQLDGILAQVAAYARQQPTKKLALVGGMLLDGRDAPPLHHAAILIEGNRIVRVGRAAEVAIPPDAEVIDTSGRVMMPGLIDTHAHLQILGHGDYDRWDP